MTFIIQIELQNAYRLFRISINNQSNDPSCTSYSAVLKVATVVFITVQSWDKAYCLFFEII